MGLFHQTGNRMFGRTTLLLSADPGDTLLDAVRLYDPEFRRWPDRLIFHNRVLLYGPVTMTPKIERQAVLPAGAAVAWYTGAAGGDKREDPRPREAKLADGDCLVRGLAVRLSGTTHPAALQPKLQLMASVYSEQDLRPRQVVEVLRPLGGDLRLEDLENDTYNIGGDGIYFFTSYRAPERFLRMFAPAALGKLRSGRLHHWDIMTGVQASQAARELCLRIGEAALALAGQVDGVVTDVLGFRVTSAEDLLLP
jgi:hypothetical protein